MHHLGCDAAALAALKADQAVAFHRPRHIPDAVAPVQVLVAAVQAAAEALEGECVGREARALVDAAPVGVISPCLQARGASLHRRRLAACAKHAGPRHQPEVRIMANEQISKADKARITRLDNIDSAFVMLFLVNQFHNQLQVCSKELILAICWEESFFQNIQQVGGPAVGYGQLERDGRRIANQHLTGNPANFSEGAFTAPAILSSQQTSIRAVSHCLAGLFASLGSQAAALNGYAGVLQRPVNAVIPPRWKACENDLRNVLSAGPAFNPIAFEKALRKSREFETSGPIYDHIHSKLWPLVDLLQQLVSQVQIGSQGLQAMIVQDSMNRLLNVQSNDALAPLPLAVDGRFGPKTHARVKEFQGKNSLAPDGVVGPMTRGALKGLAQKFKNA